MKKLRVLQVITKGEWAGAQRVVFEICKHIKEKKNDEIDMEVAVGDSGLLTNKLRELGIKVYNLNNLKREINLYVDYKGYREIKQLIIDGKYDVVHCHSTKAGILGRLASKKLKVNKIIFTVHGFWPIFQYKGLKRNIAAIVERFMERITTDVVYISKSDIKIAKKLKIYRQKSSKLIYNSITLPKEIKGSLRSELNLDESVNIIGNISRISEQKNPVRFVEIAKEYFGLYPDNNTVFIWIGDGPQFDEIGELVNIYELTNKVRFIGFRDHAERYMKDFDLLLMTSNWEGVPITILEAIGLNVPILSSNVGGISEVIGENNVYNLSLINQEIARKLKSVDVPIYHSYSEMPEKYVDTYFSNLNYTE